MSKFPATITDEQMTAFVVNVAKEILGEDKILMMKPLMGSEDFSFCLQKIPGTFAFLGVENKEKGIIYPQHLQNTILTKTSFPLELPFMWQWHGSI